MMRDPPRETVSDYARFDFRALWPGREKVTEVERAIVVGCLAPGDRRRILELGTGFGRLLGPLTELAREVVATDFDLESLSRLARPADARVPVRVAANLYHLPFVDGAFTGASMVRVYHHLSDPVAALTEVSRVLSPGSSLLLSYNPKPTIGTFVNDVQRAIHASDHVPFRSITFARGRIVLPPDPFPVYVAGRRDFARTIGAVGLRPVREVVSGLEEYYLMRYVPARLFLRLGAVFGRAPAFPTRFVLLAKPPAPPAALPEIGRILACPRCRSPWPEGGPAARPECSKCGFRGEVHGGVIDFRYLPEGVRRWEAAG